MTCKYGNHKWEIKLGDILDIKCMVCGEVVEQPNREHTSDLQYTKDEYDF